MGITFTGSGTNVDPIQISGISTNFEAIKAEYEYLNQTFGKRGAEWKLERQVLIQAPNERMCDVLHIELADGTKVEVWFDITPYFGKY
ncbi:MAG: hypothetical protein ACFFDP_00205 [Promethearchaeota archaeon]